MRTSRVAGILLAAASACSALTTLQQPSPIIHHLTVRQVSNDPTVTIKNGTYQGVHVPEYNQDFFLGVPYAQPPVGQLRLRNPVSLNSSFDGVRLATSYSLDCVNYGTGLTYANYVGGEDCLYVSIVRPANATGPLPVATWIFGGGLFQGGSSDPRYNLSFIVQNSQALGKPMIGISFNYRLSGWGFLASDEVSGSGNTNIGLRDQRLALQWIKENIAAFGGDPNKITIWGESAGAVSVGLQLMAYGGRDDGLFRGAIMESGNAIPNQSLNGTDYFEPYYNQVLNTTGCTDAVDTLDCLRSVPFNTLNGAFNTTAYSVWFPVVDGDIIQKYPSIQLAAGDFVKVPIIVGANTDEGSSFSPHPINNVSDWIYQMTQAASRPGVNLPLSIANQIIAAYPDDPCPPNAIPQTLGCSPAAASLGAEYRRAAAYYGDTVFIANRRLTCQTWASNGLPAYCYRFNALPNGQTIANGVRHFVEVAFVFDSVLGLGYNPNPFANRPQSYVELAKFMSNSWVSFVVDQDPNSFRVGAPVVVSTGLGNVTVPQWAKYDNARPLDFVFDANVTSYLEPDTYRKAGIDLINSLSVLYRR